MKQLMIVLTIMTRGSRAGDDVQNIKFHSEMEKANNLVLLILTG